MTLTKWQELGVRTALGEPLPSRDIGSSLVIPSGNNGAAAFLVYDNFDTTTRRNRLKFFALSVGLLADRIAGAPAMHRQPPDDVIQLSREEVMQIQLDLNGLVFNPGPSDGMLGPAPHDVLCRFQRSADVIADGHRPSRRVGRLTENRNRSTSHGSVDTPG